MPLAELRPVQDKAITMLRQSIANGNSRTILQAPTGFGKTVIACHLIHGANRKGKRVCMCVPALTLVDQTVERLVENAINLADIGVIQGDHPLSRPQAPIQVATAQTLARRPLPNADLVIVDEAHVRYQIIDRWIESAPKTVFVGLSATPWAKGLGKLYSDLVKPTSTQELIELGWLSPFRVWAPSSPDLKDVRTVAGDYHEADLGAAVDKPALVADIVSIWLVKGRGRPTLCFAVNRLHAQHIVERFQAAGVRTAYVDADTPREERELIGRGLRFGEYEVVVNIGCLTTGIDWDVRCIILARPTKSEALFVQIIGRGLRTADGKDYCLILDHSDTHLRLGMVTEIDRDKLDDGAARKTASGGGEGERKAPLPKACTSCGCLIPTMVMSCPSCGAAKPKPPTFEEGEGDLVEFGGRSNPRGGKGETIADRVRAMGKAEVYAQLAYVANEKGRKEGWVAHSYKEIFEVWPQGFKGSVPKYPTPELMAWVRNKDRRWVYGQKGKGAAA